MLVGSKHLNLQLLSRKRFRGKEGEQKNREPGTREAINDPRVERDREKGTLQ